MDACSGLQNKLMIGYVRQVKPPNVTNFVFQSYSVFVKENRKGRHYNIQQLVLGFSPGKKESKSINTPVDHLRILRFSSSPASKAKSCTDIVDEVGRGVVLEGEPQKTTFK